MNKQNKLDNLQAEIERKAKLRAKKKRRNMKVSGAKAKKLERIIKNK